MTINFSKYQGTGNDFILLNNLNGAFNKISIATIKLLCDRRFGIGADGLILIHTASDFDFEVDYYNADGSKSFCGNGARCAVAFAETIGFSIENSHFKAIDGLHTARKLNQQIALDMLPVKEVIQYHADFTLNTGSPHYIQFVPDLAACSIVETGKAIRYSASFNKEGINVNQVEIVGENHLSMLTYERGVEDETLSCGTGATAAAIAYVNLNNRFGKQSISIDVKGGKLTVQLEATENKEFVNIQLIGPAEHVYDGTIELNASDV
jgi:diaminopimelate epimerase